MRFQEVGSSFDPVELPFQEVYEVCCDRNE